MVEVALNRKQMTRKCDDTGSFSLFHTINGSKGPCQVFSEHTYSTIVSHNAVRWGYWNKFVARSGVLMPQAK